MGADVARIGGERALYAAQAQFKRDITMTLQRTSDQAAGILRRYAAADGTISVRNETAVQREIGNLVSRLFVSNDGRSAFGSDGTTPLAPFGRLLNANIIAVTRSVVEAHVAWMRRTLPDDVYRQLAAARGLGTAAQFGARAQAVGGVVQELTAVDYQRLIERYRSLRIFAANPLAEYESAHTWVDPRGYRLSDRIWGASLRTRLNIDAMLADGIRSGRGSFNLARDLEGFLLPGRLGKRTTRPYGRDASFDAMRLARTEIARAHAQAALTAARMNPYVTGIDVARSTNGDRTCRICPEHATIDISGMRVRDPYPLDSAPISTFHPHCMCHTRPVVTASPGEVTAQLRAALDDARDMGVEPVATPAASEAFLLLLLGAALYADSQRQSA